MIELSKKVTKGLIDSNANDFFLKLLQTELFVSKTVGELIQGYDDPIITFAHVFLPALVKQDKFSLTNGVNQIYCLKI